MLVPSCGYRSAGADCTSWVTRNFSNGSVRVIKLKIDGENENKTKDKGCLPKIAAGGKVREARTEKVRGVTHEDGWLP